MLNSLQKAFMPVMKNYFMVTILDVKLSVDGEDIALNKFVAKMLSGTLVGAVMSLTGIKKDWNEIKVKVTK